MWPSGGPHGTSGRALKRWCFDKGGSDEGGCFVREQQRAGNKSAA